MDDAPLDRSLAKSRLNWCIEYGTVISSKHFREELLNDDFTMEDVFRICKSGSIYMAPEKDTKTGHWKCRIEGRTLEPTGSGSCLYPAAGTGSLYYRI